MPTTTSTNPTPLSGSAILPQRDTSQPAEWTSEIFRPSPVQMLMDSSDAIGSQESRGGNSPSSLPVGVDLFGRPVYRANPSVQPANAKAGKTTVTFGRCFTASSASENLQRFLESRLKQRLDTDGSTEYSLTWKRKVTPA